MTNVLIKSADIFCNQCSILESLPYLQESSYHIAMIPIMENSRLDANLIEVSDIFRYMNESGTLYGCFDDVVIDIAESNNIYPESVVLVTEDSSIDLYRDILEESVFYTVCKYNPNIQYRLMESDNNQNKGIRDSIADKLKKAKDWAQGVIDKIDKLPANKKGIFTKLKLYIVKFIRWITDTLETFIRPIRFAPIPDANKGLRDIAAKEKEQMTKIRGMMDRMGLNKIFPTNSDRSINTPKTKEEHDKVVNNLVDRLKDSNFSFEEFDKTMSDPTKPFKL